MKKLLLAILLLAVVVGVAWVKTDRQAARDKDTFNRGRQTVASELTAARHESDSLRQTIGEREVAVAETLVHRDIEYQAAVDSLAATIDSLGQTVTQLQSKLKSAQTAASPKSSPTKSSAKAPSRHEQILAYYNQRYRDLPKDLSPYEQRVALNEIREETARKFSISVTEVNSIRSKYKLDY